QEQESSSTSILGFTEGRGKCKPPPKHAKRPARPGSVRRYSPGISVRARGPPRKQRSNPGKSSATPAHSSSRPPHSFSRRLLSLPCAAETAHTATPQRSAFRWKRAVAAATSSRSTAGKRPALPKARSRGDVPSQHAHEYPAR